MTEIEALKWELEQKEEAFHMLHKRYIDLLKKQGELERENRLLKSTLKQEEEVSKELEQFKTSIIAFAECNENINRRTLNELIEGIDYDR